MAIGRKHVHNRSWQRRVYLFKPAYLSSPVIAVQLSLQVSAMGASFVYTINSENVDAKTEIAANTTR